MKSREGGISRYLLVRTWKNYETPNTARICVLGQYYVCDASVRWWRLPVATVEPINKALLRHDAVAAGNTKQPSNFAAQN